MKIGILTSGGDCPGLNAVIRGVVLKGTTAYNLEFVGIRDGWRGVVDGDRFPALQAVLDAGVFDRADPADDELAFGLDRILDGVEVLVRRRG